MVIEDRTFFTDEETPLGKKYDKILICQMIGFLIDNIYIKIGNQLFRQSNWTMNRLTLDTTESQSLKTGKNRKFYFSTKSNQIDVV